MIIGWCLVGYRLVSYRLPKRGQSGPVPGAFESPPDEVVPVPYAKARAELMIPHLPGGVLERGERVGLLAAGGVFGLMVPALWLLAIGTTWTAGQRIAAAYRELELLDKRLLDGREGDAHG